MLFFESKCTNKVFVHTERGHHTSFLLLFDVFCSRPLHQIFFSRSILVRSSGDCGRYQWVCQAPCSKLCHMCPLHSLRLCGRQLCKPSTERSPVNDREGWVYFGDESFKWPAPRELRSCPCCRFEELQLSPLLPPQKVQQLCSWIYRDFWESFTASDDTYQVRHTPQRAKD